MKEELKQKVAIATLKSKVYNLEYYVRKLEAVVDTHKTYIGRIERFISKNLIGFDVKKEVN